MPNPITTLGARIGRWLTASSEFDARRRAEELWRLSEERLQMAMEVGKVGLWDWDIEANRVTWTPSLYALHGLEPGDFDGTLQGFEQLTHPEDLAIVRRAIERAVNDDEPYELEFRVRHPGGRVAWVYTDARLIRDEKGRPLRMVGACVDIDARKRIELALRDSEHRLRLALHAANAGVWRIDILTDELFWSDEFRSLYGYDASTQPSYDVWMTRLHPDDRDRVESDLRRRLTSSEQAFRDEFRIIHPSLGVRWILAIGQIERDATGRAIVVSGISLDITRTKQVEEELREADQRKNEFLATLAHELRNPLAPIRNGLEILRLTHAGGESAERARNMMDRQLKQMVRLIDDLLDVSRISRGKVQLRREPIDLKSALQSALEVCEPLIASAGHELKVDMPAGPLIVDGDLTRLAQVFGNLLNNAAKYTNAGGLIELSVRRTSDDVSVSVRDNGVGIPPPMLAKIFDMFAQVDHSLQRAQGGLGIGLSIAKRLVEMHDGALEAHSAGLGAGSEFTVKLPLRAAPVIDAPMPASIDPASATEDALRVLIADDNSDAATSLATVLNMKGCEVRIASDGLEAVQNAATFGPDLAFLDIGMPQLNGYDACERLRRLPGGAQMTIVALTGWGQADDKRRSEDAGFDHHLVKPADVRVLDRLLNQVRTRSQSAGDRRVTDSIQLS